MSSESISSLERRWHDPAFALQWEADRRRSKRRFRRASCDESLLDHPLLSGIARSANAPADVPARARAFAEAAEWYAPREGEPLSARARRLDGESCRRANADERSAYRPPDLVARDGNEWTLAPVACKARPEKLAKAQALYNLGLTAKAQRELACGLLAGEIRCRNGHRFYALYRCGDRYCLDCGPSTAQRLFAKHLTRVTAVTNALLARHPGYVIAKVDFTRRKTCGHRGKCNCPMPNAEYNRELNTFVRRLARAIERRFGISRDEYAMAVHDEIGGGNTNAHAHAVYVGPYIPHGWLSETWRKICADGSFIISVKRANSVAAALWHATKYPAKFVRESTPERLAALELSYHRVRRFRLLGAFDKRVAERVLDAGQGQGEQLQGEELSQVLGEMDRALHCPYCDAPLKRIPGWLDMDVLEAEGLTSLDAARQEVARLHAFGGARAAPQSVPGGIKQ